jgi:hypothetical protein
VIWAGGHQQFIPSTLVKKGEGEFSFTENLDVKAIDDNALVPGPLHHSTDFVGTGIIDEGTNEVQCCIDASGVAARGNHAQATKAHGSTASD